MFKKIKKENERSSKNDLPVADISAIDRWYNETYIILIVSEYAKIASVKSE